MSEEIVEFSMELNALLQHWPDEIATVFWRLITENARKKSVPSFNPEHLEQCAASLERTFPFYKRKFDREPENRLEFTRHFFAGLCGFGNSYLEGFHVEKENISQWFGDDYIVSFEECSREHSDGNEEKTILQNAYFGDFVAAFRWLNILFQTVFDGDEDETFGRFCAVLLLGYLMDKENAYKLQQYIQPTLTKETSNNPELAKDFAQYYLNLHRRDDEEDDGDLEEPASLYSEVLREAEDAYRMQYQPKQCIYCHSFYFDGPFNDYKSHDQYCSPDCYALHNYWKLEFEKKQKNLDRAITRKQQESFADNYSFELKPLFTQDIAVKRRPSTIKGKDNINKYFYTLFASLNAKDNSKKVYYFRKELYEFLSGQRSYDSLVDIHKKHISCGYYIKKEQREFSKISHTAFDKTWFKIL